MTNHRGIIPTQQAIEAVITQVIAPVIIRCEESLKHALCTDVFVVCDESLHKVVQIGEGDVRGDVRITFKKTFHDDRLRFHVESIYQDLQGTGGFSGFTSTGKVTTVDDRVIVEGNGGAYRYNVWEWQGA